MPELTPRELVQYVIMLFKGKVVSVTEPSVEQESKRRLWLSGRTDNVEQQEPGSQ